MKYVLTDWGYDNCVGSKAPNGFIPWGYCILSDDTSVSVQRYIAGNQIAETDKAICIEYRADLTDCRCNVVKSVMWKCWLPKSQIINDMGLFFEGGHYSEVESCLSTIYKDKKIKKTWAAR